MSKNATIPLFPLTILPLPGELVPLHIFEPRYKQLLEDAEVSDTPFGIYFNHTMNAEKIGSLMKLESVIKRYPGGEADIIVKCYDILYLDMLYRTFKFKTYPGGDVRYWEVDNVQFPSENLYNLFIEYLKKRNIQDPMTTFNLYQIATELNLDLRDRYDFLLAPLKSKEQFLINRLKFQIHLLEREDGSKDVFHLN